MTPRPAPRAPRCSRLTWSRRASRSPRPRRSIVANGSRLVDRDCCNASAKKFRSRLTAELNFFHSNVAAHALAFFMRSSLAGLAIAALCFLIRKETGPQTGERMHVHALFHASLGQLLQGPAGAGAARHPA